MTTDETTIAVYDAKADDYAKAFSETENEPGLLRFMSRLPKGAAVLDLGCGPGVHSAAMHSCGFRVTATDASAAMVERARTHEGVMVHQSSFSDLREQGVYDGVWANFSLLHEPRSEFPGHLSRIAAALKPEGILHLAMKTGSGESRDQLGRYYTFYSADELRGFEL